MHLITLSGSLPTYPDNRFSTNDALSALKSLFILLITSVGSIESMSQFGAKAVIRNWSFQQFFFDNLCNKINAEINNKNAGGKGTGDPS